MAKAFITGLAGEALTAEERAFLASEKPCGIILFTRNCVEQDQIKSIVRDAVHAIGGDIPPLVLIDQEGGRVQRLRPPLGRALPPGEAYAKLYARDPQRACLAAKLVAELTAHDLLELGINTNCAPVLDVPVPGSHDIIGDRAYGTTPLQVAALGTAVAEGYLAGGVLPVIKHIPGHGRATKDSHLDLPVVTASHAELSATDFASFKRLAGMPAAMTAHVVFTALDPDAPASTSAKVTREVIRGEIGFDGMLMSDDLSMKALSGSLAARARAVLAAGSDVALHCNGNLEEMAEVARNVPELQGDALRRVGRAAGLLARSRPFDPSQSQELLTEVLELASQGPESV